MTNYPLELSEITSWLESKQVALAGSDVAITAIRERSEYLAASGADFEGTNTVGHISGWISGDFDFEVFRVSDEKNTFLQHVEVVTIGELETVYSDFLRALRTG